eukprot:107705-Chlamydomonas_euryale.AAC.1
MHPASHRQQQQPYARLAAVLVLQQRDDDPEQPAVRQRLRRVRMKCDPHFPVTLHLTCDPLGAGRWRFRNGLGVCVSGRRRRLLLGALPCWEGGRGRRIMGAASHEECDGRGVMGGASHEECHGRDVMGGASWDKYCRKSDIAAAV